MNQPRDLFRGRDKFGTIEMVTPTLGAIRLGTVTLPFDLRHVEGPKAFIGAMHEWLGEVETWLFCEADQVKREDYWKEHHLHGC